MGIAPEFAGASTSVAGISGVTGTMANESERASSKSISALVEAVGTAVAGTAVAVGTAAGVGAAIIDEQKMN